MLAADNPDNDIRAARGGDSSNFLSGAGEMGAIMRAYDWSQSALGPPEKWPQSRRTVVRLMLNTGHPVYVWEMWDEIWPIIGPQYRDAAHGWPATRPSHSG